MVGPLLLWGCRSWGRGLGRSGLLGALEALPVLQPFTSFPGITVLGTKRQSQPLACCLTLGWASQRTFALSVERGWSSLLTFGSQKAIVGRKEIVFSGPRSLARGLFRDLQRQWLTFSLLIGLPSELLSRKTFDKRCRVNI